MPGRSKNAGDPTPKLDNTIPTFMPMPAGHRKRVAPLPAGRLASGLLVCLLVCPMMVMPGLHGQEAPVASEPSQPQSLVQAAVAVPVQRGILFRITPPKRVLLPAEGAETAMPVASPDAGPPSAEPEGAGDSYLLGTIHFGTPEEQGIDYEQLAVLLAKTATFVSEADTATPWIAEYDHYRWLPADKPLQTLVGKDEIIRAHALLPAIRMQDLQRMKPWAVLALLEARGETGGDTTMDARLQQLAMTAGKRMAHLETLEQQLQALDCVPAEEHALVLGERVRKSWVLRIESAEAMAFYRSRNLDAWLTSIDRLDGLDDVAKAIEHRSRVCLLEDRNARWIGQLETLFQDGPCFVAVGAVHLVGEDGLLARLRRNGYQVEVVPL